jgi:hypothetical protein
MNTNDRINARAVNESNRSAFRMSCLAEGGDSWRAYCVIAAALCAARAESAKGRR